jgi:DNA-binding response OmpR family regulator
MASTPTTEHTPLPLRAAIISSELAPSLLEQMTERLVSAGFADVSTFDDVSRVAQPPRGKRGKYRLAPSLRGPMLIVMDEGIGAVSAFDVHAILKAAPELKGPRFFLLLNDAADATVFAAWEAGIHCVLTKPFVMDEFATFAGRLYEALAGEQTG